MADSAIHKATSRHSAGGWNNPWGLFQPPAPFTAYGSFRNCTGQNHGMVRNHEAGGFVNSAVRQSLAETEMEKTPTLTSTIPVEWKNAHWL